MSATSQQTGRGDMLPDVRGTSADGTRQRLRELHYMRANVALVILRADEQGLAWMRASEAVVDAAAAEHGRIVILSPDAVASNLPLRNLPVLVDADGGSLQRLGLTSDDLPAIYVADRYGQVFAATHGANAEPDMTPADLPRWLNFIDCRCS